MIYIVIDISDKLIFIDKSFVVKIFIDSQKVKVKNHNFALGAL